MRLINIKTQVKKANLPTILIFVKQICLQVPRFKFEIIETEHTFQFKFYLLKSRISPIEKYWLKKRIKKFIHEDS